VIIETLIDALKLVQETTGLTMLLVEQKADVALSLTKDAIVLDRGQIVWRGASDDLKRDEAAQAKYLGVGSEHVG
jgi:branched-chain amino acid transport system ATP-binding protein